MNIIDVTTRPNKCPKCGGENIGDSSGVNSELNTSAQRLYKGFIEILSQSPIKARNVDL